MCENISITMRLVTIKMKTKFTSLQDMQNNIEQLVLECNIKRKEGYKIYSLNGKKTKDKIIIKLLLQLSTIITETNKIVPSINLDKLCLGKIYCFELNNNKYYCRCIKYNNERLGQFKNGIYYSVAVMEQSERIILIDTKLLFEDRTSILFEDDKIVKKIPFSDIDEEKLFKNEDIVSEIKPKITFSDSEEKKVFKNDDIVVESNIDKSKKPSGSLLKTPGVKVIPKELSQNSTSKKNCTNAANVLKTEGYNKYSIEKICKDLPNIYNIQNECTWDERSEVCVDKKKVDTNQKNLCTFM